jgi:hypothetical protein
MTITEKIETKRALHAARATLEEAHLNVAQAYIEAARAFARHARLLSDESRWLQLRMIKKMSPPQLKAFVAHTRPAFEALTADEDFERWVTLGSLLTYAHTRLARCP